MYYYVYLIRSIASPAKIYAGYTENLQERLETHNLGGSIYTQHDRPWELVMFFCFTDKAKAASFEKYLKSHAGRAFAAKRFY